MNDEDCLWLAELSERLAGAMAQAILGQEDAIRFSFSALLCDGHVLLQGVPGIAKTLTVRSLAACLGVRFGRIQFTPDLMPTDVTGTPVFDASSSSFHFRPGPIFTDLLLADEINRAPAKTQAALLEAMQERQVSVDGKQHPLGEGFSVFATQNPVEHEGTYALPEAELDRFLYRIDLFYPDDADELRLLSTRHAADPDPTELVPLLGLDDLRRARRIVTQVLVRDEILRYALDLVVASRHDPGLSLGASPRAGLMLVRAAKSLAAMAGRAYVLPEDVQQAWLPVMRHRVLLEPAAEIEGLGPDDILGGVLRSITAPR